MLRQLSLRNAKRQSKEYSLYFITLACTVSFMYAFNTLIFSDIIQAFSGAEVLPYMNHGSLLINRACHGMDRRLHDKFHSEEAQP